MTQEELMHYGTLRLSGRYPWGSGANPNQHHPSFLADVARMRKEGLSDTDIARGFGISTTVLRANLSIEKNRKREADRSQAVRMKERGTSNVAIGERMGINESSVRALLDPALSEKNDILTSTADVLRDNVDSKGYIDIGSGTELSVGVSADKMNTAVAILKEEGYQVNTVKVQQLGTGNFTKVKVLCPPDTQYKDLVNNTDKIMTIDDYTTDAGRTWVPIGPPKDLSSDRVGVRYVDEGGGDMDGVIQVRRGVDDVSLGASGYAQVRVAVDGTHYLKGMAMYADDLPDGVDVMFNTNKADKGDKLSAMKAMKNDPENPFGATVSQRTYIDKNGNEQQSVLNIVNEPGDWYNWSQKLSSQMVSKQSPTLAKEQLDLAYRIKKDEYDEIMSLTNPAVRKTLLDSFAGGADSASVRLQAAALPRTRNHVILPFNSLKDSEVYAPQYRDGERVALIRHPHGGIFEIPELTVNNRNAEAKSILGRAKDAIGINAKVAARLSGADFDGDTVLVIPNNSKSIKSSPPLQGLKDFDPQTRYPGYEGMKPMSPRTKQHQMGNVSNLITDMTIRGASNSEIARAVRHSMVVIDAEKHTLNWKQSQVDNGIADLKSRYQGSASKGASTLISRASSEKRVAERKPRLQSNGGPIDKATGALRYEPTGTGYTNSKGVWVTRQTKSTRMAETDDAYSLSSGTPMESVYANHANKLKALANEARKSSVNTARTEWSPSAKETYSKEVATLKGKLNTARKNSPRERKAQLFANALVKAKTQANPNMDPSDLKREKTRALDQARARFNAKKERITFTPSEWAAVQAGAISNSMLNSMLANADLDQVKSLATPRTKREMSPAKTARAKNMLNAGHTQAEIADALGVPTSTLNDAL